MNPRRMHSLQSPDVSHGDTTARRCCARSVEGAERAYSLIDSSPARSEHIRLQMCAARTRDGNSSSWTFLCHNRMTTPRQKI